MFARQFACRAFLSIVFCCIAAPAFAAYSFVNISKDVPGFDHHGATINNSGTVAFATLGPDPNVANKWQAIYSGRGGPLNKLVQRGRDSAWWGLWDPDINLNGVVAFKSYVDTPGQFELYSAGIFTAGPNGVKTVAQHNNGTFTEDAAINDKGQVVSVVKWNATGASSVVTYSPKRTIATFSNPANAFGQPDLNNSGVVVFPTLVGSEERIVTSTGGKQTAIATTKGTNFASLLDAEPRINDLGAIAFQAELKSGGAGIYGPQGIFVVDKQGLHKVVDTAGAYEILENPSLNNRGQVAFKAWRKPGFGGDGVFIGPDPIADRVIGEGDLLDGELVLEAHIGTHALNDAGQITFHAYLSNGQEGVYRADPMGWSLSAAVPEPSALAIVITACGGLVLTRKTRFPRRKP